MFEPCHFRFSLNRVQAKGSTPTATSHQSDLAGANTDYAEASSAQPELGDRILTALRFVKLPVTSHESDYQSMLV